MVLVVPAAPAAPTAVIESRAVTTPDTSFAVLEEEEEESFFEADYGRKNENVINF